MAGILPAQPPTGQPGRPVPPDLEHRTPANARPDLDSMAYRLMHTPWALAARGAAALGFGLLTLAWPAMTVATFLALFAALALTDGAATLVAAWRFRRRGRDVRGVRDPLFLVGAAGVALGLVAALWPNVTMQALLALMTAWAAVSGGGTLYVATRGKPRLPGWWLLGGAGAAALALAVVLVLALAVGEVRVGWEVGLYGVTAGALLAACAWQQSLALARQPRRRATDAPADAADAIDAPGGERFVPAVPATAPDGSPS